MYVLTSIPPFADIEYQQMAIDSWIASGLKVISLNHPDESIPPYDGVEFVHTYRTHFKMFGKHFVLINAFLDWAKGCIDSDVFILLNSDVHFRSELQFPKDQLPQKAFAFNRHNYGEDIDNSRIFESGFDVFVLHRDHLNVFPQSMYAMGLPWWDYWFPFCLLESGIVVDKFSDSVVYHKEHQVAYKQNSVDFFEEYFRLENKSSRMTADVVHSYLDSKMTRK